VIALVDRLQERVEVGDRPFLNGRCYQNDWLRTTSQAFFQGFVPASLVGSNDERLSLATATLEEVEQSLADRVGVRMVAARHHDDEHLAVRNRVALGGQVERVNPVLSRIELLGRPGRQERPHASVALGASQESSAAL
jgi:hypothetical protein